MTRKLARLINITEPRFGFSDYRKPIVWFDQTLVVSGNLAAIAGRVLALVWTVAFVVRPSGEPPSCALLAAGILLWAPGEYFCRTGHRGLIYHHTDLLTDYVDGRIGGSEGGTDAAVTGTE